MLASFRLYRRFYRVCRLNSIQVCVDALFGEKFVMRPLFGNDASLENDDLMRVANRAQPMGNGNYGASLHQPLEGFHHELLGFGVERGRRLVENQDWRVADDGASDADPLPLTAGKRGAALTDHRIKTMRHFGDEFFGIGKPGRLLNVALRGVGPAVGNVLANRAAKEDGVLLDKPYLVAQAIECEFAELDAVDCHAAARGVIESRDQTYDCGFAAAGWANDSDTLPGLDGEIYVAENRRLRIIGKGHAVEHDFAA